MRKLAWFAGAFSAAVFLAVYLLPEGLLLPVGLACALAALLGLLLRGDRRRRMMLACLGLAAGLVWTGTFGQLIHAPAQALAGTEGPISATAADWPRETAYGSSVLVYLHPEEGLPIYLQIVDFIQRGGIDNKNFDTIVSYLLHNDQYMSLADFDSYRLCQQTANDVYRDQMRWNRMSLKNIAESGIFSADRSIQDYIDGIWYK